MCEKYPTLSFNKDVEVGRLLHDIREDKPGFQALIKIEDLRRVICVRAKLDNARIARQDGAFLLFEVGDKKKYHARLPNEWIVCGPGTNRIIFSNKSLFTIYSPVVARVSAEPYASAFPVR